MAAKPVHRASPSRASALVISCEHASNRVPRELAAMFTGRKALLASHRGWDPGALDIARALARRFDAPVHAGRWSRLCIDLNRSAHHPKLFEEKLRGLPREQRAELVRRYHAPYRHAVERAIAELLQEHRRVLHISVHSFTPVLQGQRRNAEIGLLHDPKRAWEDSLCRAWKETLQEREPHCRVRRNYPYAGTSDGLTKHLREQFAAQRYAGIELEVNQSWSTDARKAQRVIAAFGDVLAKELGR